MSKRKIVLVFVAVSFCLAVTLGLLDRESKSLVHLFTAEWGYVIALLIYTALFSAIGLGASGVFRVTERLLR